MPEVYEAKVGDHIKIHITLDGDELGGESLWAEELGDNTAKINNLPWFCDTIVGFDDIIRYEIQDGIREFVEVLTSVTNSWGVTWEPTDKDDEKKTQEEWGQITSHLRANNVKFESAFTGAFVIALPTLLSLNKNKNWLKALAYTCPITLQLYDNSRTEDN